MSNTTPKLFLLDAMALIYRAHFAFSKAPRVTSKGMNTSATFGFTNTLLEVLSKEKPTHIGVAFDTSAPTFRHVEFELYKAQRQAQPEDISVAIPYVKKIVEAFNIPVLVMDGFEADDIIGTVALKAAAEGFEVYMMTPDKDYAQLVRDNVYLYKPSFMGKGVDVMGVKEVLEKWEIERVDQVTDILGLQGDAVDNIPGIPGVGEKTAKKLIAEWGSVENLIANAGKLKGKLQENVLQFAEQGVLSKRLATIDINVPVECNFEKLTYSGPDKEVLSQLFEELEFKTIAKRIFGEISTAPVDKKSGPVGQMGLFDQEKTEISTFSTAEGRLSTEFSTNMSDINTVIHNYHLVSTAEERKLLINHLLMQDELCFDTETDNLEALLANLVGIAFSYLPGEAYYVTVPASREVAQAIVDEFKPVFEKENITFIGQNLKYDITVLKRYGVKIKGKLFDTMLAHYLLEPDMRHNMEVLSESYLNYTPVPIEKLIGKKGKNQSTMREVDPALIAEYAGEDADVTLQLKKVFEPSLKTQKLEGLLMDVEAPLIDVLSDMEMAGVRVDMNALGELSGILGGETAALEKQIYEIAGVEFNIGSPKQLGEVLFERLKLDDKAKKTKTGQYATGEEILTKLAYKYPIAKLITEYRELQKLKSTYVDALPLLINKETGRVHTNYNQAVAATGRLSSTNPNLQNIPIRTERGREIRKAFVPRNEEYVIFSADYSQIELRIMASLSKDESMINAFRNGIDIHTTTASKVFKVPLEEVTSDMRRKAKTVNFGIIYGISAFGLSQRIDIPRKEASEIIAAYFEEFPAIKNYMDQSIQTAREQEYVTTLLGRRRYLADINSRNMTLRGYAERNAINAPIQGSAADMIKMAMIRIHDWMKGQNLKSKMILQVHDELVFDAHRSELDMLRENVAHHMKEAMQLEVPLEVGMGEGINWLEAH
jgi:DNA polymerase I